MVQTPIPDLLYRGVHIRGFWLGVYLGSLGNKRLAMLQEVMGYLEDGTMSPLSGAWRSGSADFDLQL